MNWDVQKERDCQLFIWKNDHQSSDLGQPGLIQTIIWDIIPTLHETSSHASKNSTY